MMAQRKTQRTSKMRVLVTSGVALILASVLLAACSGEPLSTREKARYTVLREAQLPVQ